MKTKIIKSKYFILWLIVWLSLLWTWVYASVTGAWTLWSLFEKVGSVYRLIWDNIKDNTVDSSEIENETLLSEDIKNWEVKNVDLADNSVNSAKVVNNSLTSDDLAANSVWNSELQDNLDIQSINNWRNWSISKYSWVKIDDTLWVKKNLYVDGGINFKCRICFKETEWSTQCQGNRNSCSDWNWWWTLPFRDDTDGRDGGCKYQWKVECKTF